MDTIKMKIPVLYVGPPGVGKTATVRARYDHCEVLLLSSCTEEHIGGLPYRVGRKERYTIPHFIERLQQAKGTKCLFLDELDKARREVADTLLTLVTHPQDFGIPKDCDIYAAANPPEWGGGDGVSIPMMNRFSVIEFVPNIQEWSEFMLNKYSSVPFISEFLEGIKLNKAPLLEVVGEGYSRRLTCPRSWDMALYVYTTVTDPDEAKQKISGLLTANAVSYLYSFIHKNEPEYSTMHKVEEIARKLGSKKINYHQRLDWS